MVPEARLRRASPLRGRFFARCDLRHLCFLSRCVPLTEAAVPRAGSVSFAFSCSLPRAHLFRLLQDLPALVLPRHARPAAAHRPLAAGVQPRLMFSSRATTRRALSCQYSSGTSAEGTFSSGGRSFLASHCSVRVDFSTSRWSCTCNEMHRSLSSQRSSTFANGLRCQDTAHSSVSLSRTFMPCLVSHRPQDRY